MGLVLEFVSAIGNVIGGNVLTSGVVSAAGNITGSYIVGNGSQLTGLPAGYSNATAASFLVAFGSNSISTTGTITSGNITAANVIATGNLYYNSNVLVTRSLTVGTRTTPASILLTAGGSFNVLTRASGNVSVTTST